jgi:hypothetical protein
MMAKHSSKSCAVPLDHKIASDSYKSSIIFKNCFLILISSSMKKIVFFLFLICNLQFVICNLYAQPVTQEWVKRYSGIYIPPNSNGGATGKSIKLDSLGNVYVLVGEAIWDSAFGAKGVFGVLKYSSTGNPIWSTYYSTPGQVSDGSVAFAVSKTGDVYVTGYTGINSIYHTTTVKFDSSGILKWVKVYYGGGGDDEPTDIAIDKENNIVVIGNSLITSNNINALTIKYNGNGDSLWVRKFSQFTVTNHYKIALDDSSNIYTVGMAVINGGDYLILKYDKNGNLKWYSTYNSPQNYSDFGLEIAIDPNRNIYVVGTSAVPAYGDNNALLKINPANGIIQWSRIFTGVIGGNGMCEYPKGIVVTPDGNSIYYTTFCYNGTGGGGHDIVTLKYNSVGDTQWVRRYWGSVNATANEPAVIKLDQWYNVYVAGRGNYQTSGDDFVTIKYLSDGTQKWVITYNGPLTNSFDGARDLVIDSSLIYVTGVSSRQNSPNIYWDATTIKYNQPLGINTAGSELPKKYVLHQNYPNPFNSLTTIVYEIANKAEVNINLYNALGQIVRTLVNGEQDAGYYSVITNFENLSSNIYFYSLIVDGQIIDTKKLVLIK